MTTPPRDLLEKLERATAPSADRSASPAEGAANPGAANPGAEHRVAEGDADDVAAETAALRDAWQAFSRLLDTADAQWNAAPPPVSQFVFSADESVRSPRTLPESKRLRMALVAAAGLLLAVGVAVWMRSGRSTAVDADPQNLVASKAPPSSAITSDAAPASLGAGPSHADLPTLAADDATTADSWDDTFEQQLEAAREQLVRVQADWSLPDSSIHFLGWRVEQLDSELGADAL